MTQIMSNYIRQNILNRQEIVETYLENDNNERRLFICRFFKRGCCLFTKEECKFAHGPEDLQWKKLDYETFLSGSKIKDANKAAVSPQEKQLESTEEENYVGNERKHQPSLMLEMNYKDIYQYQFVLKERQVIKTILPQEAINQDRNIRKQIRVHFHRDLQRSFLDYFYSQYGTNHLNKTFIERCFNSIGWIAHWKDLLCPKYAYEAKTTSLAGTVIVRQITCEALDVFMNDSIIKIIKDNKLLNGTSISSSTINKLYYQNIVKNNEILPTMTGFLRARDFNSLDDYLSLLQTKEEFLTGLANAHENNIDEIKNMSIFLHSAQEMEELFRLIRKVLQDTVEGSSNGLVLYSRYEENVMQKCKKQLQQFNNNLPQIKKLMMKIVLEENMLPINLVSDLYLFSPNKFKCSKFEELNKSCENKQGCLLAKTDHISQHKFFQPRPEKKDAYIPDRQSEEFLDKEIDIKKVIVVDSEETLAVAKDHLRETDAISIDLEGALRKGGRLELVQCGTRDKIFVFDIFGLKQSAKLNLENVSLYNEAASLLKELIENVNICKIFHDGRKDSLALHLFLDACPANTFDLSAVHILIDQLQSSMIKLDKIANAKGNEAQGSEETKTNSISNTSVKKGLLSNYSVPDFNMLDESKLPGLNDVLRIYQASHGLNGLKNVMKKRWSAVPIEYFLQRPIDKEFLIYSSKDVEDLIEVRDTMKMKLKEVLTSFIGEIDNQKIDLLCHKASETFESYGCSNI